MYFDQMSIIFELIEHKNGGCKVLKLFGLGTERSPATYPFRVENLRPLCVRNTNQRQIKCSIRICDRSKTKSKSSKVNRKWVRMGT